MKGRKPTPTHLRVIAGTEKPKHDPASEPQPKRAKRPKAPDHLNAATAAIWDQVVKELDSISILTSVDVFAVEILASAISDHRTAVQQLADNAASHIADEEAGVEPTYSANGHYYRVVATSGSLTWKAHPAQALKSDADRRIRGWCAEFGLTPAARTRLTVGTGGSIEQADDEDEFFGT